MGRAEQEKEGGEEGWEEDGGQEGGGQRKHDQVFTTDLTRGPLDHKDGGDRREEGCGRKRG